MAAALPSGATAAQKDNAPQSLPALVTAYAADERSVASFHNLPWSESRFDRLESFYRSWEARLETLDFDALGPSERVDYVLLRNEIQRSLAGLGRERSRLKEMEPLLGFRKTICDLEAARRDGKPLDCPAAAAALAEVAKQAKQLKERVTASGAGETNRVVAAAKPPAKKSPRQAEKPPQAPALSVTPALALQAVAAIGELRQTLAAWSEFYSGYDPSFAWWVKQPCEEAGKQLDELGKHLREDIAGQKGTDEDPMIGEPLGAEALAESIRFEFLPYSADELIAIGERELKWCEGEMKKAAKQMRCGSDWKAALAKVKADFSPPGQQDELVTQIARDAIAFTRKHDFATIPPLCEETWRLSMIPPQGLKTVPYAAYSGQYMNVAYARDDMNQEDKLMVMRGNNRAFTRLTVPHELIPGHHLQLFVSGRSDSCRRAFGTPFFVEGWALYCELRFWELRWPRSPEEKIGMLFWRMNRAARTILTLRYHLGRMTPDEMVAFLIERVGHERFGAVSEVRRFIGRQTPPLYQVAYLIGAKQLLALRSEMVPSKMTERQFNDAVLASSPIPIELLRGELLGAAPGRDAKPVWRFDGELQHSR